MKKNLHFLLKVIMITIMICTITIANVPAEAATTQVSTLSSSKQLFKSLKKVGKKISKANFTYGKSSKTNFKDSKKEKRSFCADYVTWALQENGDLPYSMRIYGSRSGKLSGSGKKAILKNYKLIECKKKTSKIKFKPGDIICLYKLSGKFGWHMMVFAKYDKNGNPLWYSGGTDALGSNGHYSKKKMTTARRLRHYEKGYTAFILRRK